MPLDDAGRAWLERRDAEWRSWSEQRDAAQAAWLAEQSAAWSAWFEAQRAERNEFERELFGHQARVTESMIAALQASTAELTAEIADGRAQIRANTQAVLRALDRLGPEPA